MINTYDHIHWKYAGRNQQQIDRIRSEDEFKLIDWYSLLAKKNA